MGSVFANLSVGMEVSTAQLCTHRRGLSEVANVRGPIPPQCAALGALARQRHKTPRSFSCSVRVLASDTHNALYNHSGRLLQEAKASEESVDESSYESGE